MNSVTNTYHNYWGKADRDKKTGEWHPLPYHSLDVAAVGQEILQAHPPLCSHLVRLTGMEPDDFERWAVFLLALHDLGKFSVTFQDIRTDLLKTLQKRSTEKISERHDTLGYLLWDRKVRSSMQESWNLPPPPQEDARRKDPQNDSH